MREIAETFKGHTVLITGATGFMGKVLVEKLLRECKEINQLYLLSRGRKGQSSTERIEAIFSSKLFAQLEKEYPKFRQKVTVLESDLSLPGLGLSPQDIEIICNEVSVVIHAAATVRFDEPIRNAFNINVRATKEIILLAQKFKNLKALVHVSTAYSHCVLDKIDEKLYNPPLSYDRLEKMIEALDDELLESLVPRMLGKWPNTYCYTKAIAEDLVKELGQNLPISIFRPGIVVASAYDTPGWIDNINGPNGMIMGAYTGFIHTIPADVTISANLVPVDMADNGLLAATARLLEHGRKPGEEIRVYNYVSSENPINYIDMKGYLEKHGYKMPPMNNLWVYFLICTKNPILHFICSVLFHYIPAAIFDTLSWISGKQLLNTSLTAVYRRLDKYVKVTAYFNSRAWEWESSNTKTLWNELAPSDRAKFKFDMNALDWDEFFRTAIMGIRMYLLKDDLSTVDKALVRYKRLTWLHNALTGFFSLVILRIAYSILPSAYCIISSLWS